MKYNYAEFLNIEFKLIRLISKLKTRPLLKPIVT